VIFEIFLGEINAFWKLKNFFFNFSRKSVREFWEVFGGILTGF
jgi:hypothetical protein